MKSICVYLGANPGKNEQFYHSVLKLGKQIALSGNSLVYGGSSHGLMGILAKSVMSHGGAVVGVMPKHLIAREVPLENLNEFIVTESMQERKLVMQKRADLFIVMPGGLGTLEEAFETWNAIKIGIINKPIGFLNIDGFFNSLFSFIEHCGINGFVSETHKKIPLIYENPELLLSDLIKAATYID